MPGRGPRPKDPSKRARTNADPIPTAVLRTERAKPPTLPSRYKGNYEVRRFWRVWSKSPQAELFSSTDWQFLLETLPLVEAYWAGDLKQAAEIRLRVAKFGATPEDRARLRMQFAEADEKDAKRGKPEQGNARERYGSLRALPDVKAAGE